MSRELFEACKREDFERVKDLLSRKFNALDETPTEEFINEVKESFKEVLKNIMHIQENNREKFLRLFFLSYVPVKVKEVLKNNLDDEKRKADKEISTQEEKLRRLESYFENEKNKTADDFELRNWGDSAQNSMPYRDWTRNKHIYIANAEESVKSEKARLGQSPGYQESRSRQKFLESISRIIIIDRVFLSDFKSAENFKICLERDTLIRGIDICTDKALIEQVLNFLIVLIKNGKLKSFFLDENFPSEKLNLLITTLRDNETIIEINFKKSSLSDNQKKKIEQIESRNKMLLIKKSYRDASVFCDCGSEYEEEKNYEQAIKWYLKASECGHAKAKFKLGKIYEIFLETDAFENEKKAIELYKEAAEKNYTDAQFELAERYSSEDRGVDKNIIEAINLYVNAAKKGHELALNRLHTLAEKNTPSALFRLGTIYDAEEKFKLGKKYEDKKDFSNEQEIIELYREAAKQNYTDAQFELAERYLRGLGVGRNIKQAIDLYVSAAKKGHALALNRLRGFAEKNNISTLFHLGEIYDKGEGVVKDETAALSYYNRAAEYGHSLALFNLGYKYSQGKGVEKNKAKAVEYYTRAAEKGHSRAIYNLAVMYKQGLGGLVKSEEKASEYYRKSAEKGYEKSLSYLKEQAEGNSVYGLYNLAEIYEKGCTLLERDDKKAIDLYYKAAKLNYKKAFDMLEKKAIQENNTYALHFLGLMYIEGRVTGRNIYKGSDFIIQAAEQGYAPAIDACVIDTLMQEEQFAEGNSKSLLQLTLARIYAVNEKNNRIAVQWYRKVADTEQKGMYTSVAQFEYAKMCAEGCVPGQGIEGVKHWYRKAARNGHVKAAEELRNLESYISIPGTFFSVEQNAVRRQTTSDNRRYQGNRSRGKFG